ncbi:MAG TPA: DUF362 domain-containing protein [Blastocatellia bacterium]|nr:DUF362 domain-containing protein [Blastocatellia bacterium]
MDKDRGPRIEDRGSKIDATLDARYSILDPRVAVTSLPAPTYTGESAPQALDKVTEAMRWSEGERGPFGRMIPRGARVLIKPNFVLHENQGPWGMDPLVTHSSLVIAAVEGALRADPSEVVVGDAPVQGCDFDSLLNVTGLSRWADRLTKLEPRFKGVRDFRRTTCAFVNGVRIADENRQSEERFVLFDLGRDSLLEAVTDGRDSFRVTCYDPRLLAKTHAPGRHQYLVAKEAIEADVIINLPKLKTHKKAGVTCALKNLVGINGNKEYLPHHRIGGSRAGGDCYPDYNPIKRAMEYVADRVNTTSSLAQVRVWNGVGRQLQRALWLTGDQLGVEGSWSGNDTVWRMCLDLNRILLYGRPDGSFGDWPQRRVLHVADAVVAGQGDGPLSPQPLPLGLILAGNNAAAVDWVGAHLLDYDPRLVPLVREAFGEFHWPVASFAPNEIVLAGDWKAGAADQVFRERENPAPVIHPFGWRDARAAL